MRLNVHNQQTWERVNGHYWYHTFLYKLAGGLKLLLNKVNFKKNVKKLFPQKARETKIKINTQSIQI